MGAELLVDCRTAVTQESIGSAADLLEDTGVAVALAVACTGVGIAGVGPVSTAAGAVAHVPLGNSVESVGQLPAAAEIVT
jgi:hypothetical protein